MNASLDDLRTALVALLTQTTEAVTAVAGAHPVATFMSFALASIYVLNRAGSAS